MQQESEQQDNPEPRSEAPVGPASQGYCRRIGEERLFANATFEKWARLGS